MKNTKSVTLPIHIRPERYRLMVHPDISSFTFKCEETIYLKINKTIRQISLHGVDLLVVESFLVQNGQEYKPQKISYKTDEDRVIFSFAKPVVVGDAEFHLKFTGVINDKMAGFYRSKYLVGEETRFMASTQFEATDARRAFLCIDEPKAKAVFDLTFLVPKTHTVVSNTHIENITEHESGYKLVTFATTPKMSTYLVAYIIGELDFVETKNKDGIVVRVFVTPGKKAQAEFALDTTAKMLSYYNDYFGIKYPMAVLDLIAIPDFAAGAMENWGAITYRETALLIDPKHSSASARQRVALVIAHELAHQWFGNLVTMEWWTHLWLNEGFASWIEYLAVDHLFPEWDIWTQFVYADLNRALTLDALKNTHPVEIEVNHPKEISEIFDAISYSKGASIIRMLADYLGEVDFRRGLNIYLTKYSFNNATTEHLWDAFEEASGKSVKKLMQNWTENPGYPLISVSEDKDGKIRLRQKRFYSSILENKKKQASTVWNIPVGYTGNMIAGKKYLLMARSDVLLEEKSLDGSFININANRSGFFRTLYDEKLLRPLQSALEKKKIGPADRLGLINDSFALSRAGLSDTTKTLELLSAYKEEDNYTVWRDISTELSGLDNILCKESFYPKFQSYVRAIFSRIVSKVGFHKRRGEGHLDSLLRELVLAQAGKYADETVIEEARSRFGKFIKDKKPLDPDLRAMVYSLVARSGDKNDFEDLMKLYRGASLQEERNRLAAALCQFRQAPLIKRALRFIISKEVRDQDAPLLLAVAASNNRARDLSWQFVKDNWGLLYSRYSGGHLSSRILTEVTSDFDTDILARDVLQFFTKNKVPGMERTVAQALERIRSNSAWKKAALPSIKKFFS